MGLEMVWKCFKASMVAEFEHCLSKATADFLLSKSRLGKKQICDTSNTAN